MRSFRDKVVVITGGGSGLGRAMAQKFNEAGAHLALCDLNMAGLEETKNMLARQDLNVSLHEVNVTDQPAMNAFAEAVIEQHGQVDVLVNNAGITLMPNLFLDIDDALFKKVVDVNMWGVYYGVRAFLPHLKERPESSIVTISSLAGLVGLYGYSPYAMTKFAVRALSESLSMELVGTGVQMLTVHPGGVRTNIVKHAPDLSAEAQDSAHKTFTQVATLTAEKAADKILKAVRKKRNRLIIGVDAKLVFAIRRWFPRAYPKILHKVFSQMAFE